ncbi:hypothetical protein LTR10_008013 [Elasticomyces elasticus]|nr:hypothetical protein LTR10_008013 [Elasticomyces elasticus]KAK4971010.1 hypothetical protein LTR42_007989 [Elasticomyces elasticus]
MLSKSTRAVLSLLLPIVSSQTTQVVAVGEDGLVFTPSSITAPVGSQVEYQFYPRNHSVVSSAFDNPCQPDGKLFSGYMPVSAGTGQWRSSKRSWRSGRAAISSYCFEQRASIHFIGNKFDSYTEFHVRGNFVLQHFHATQQPYDVDRLDTHTYIHKLGLVVNEHGPD